MKIFGMALNEYRFSKDSLRAKCQEAGPLKMKKMPTCFKPSLDNVYRVFDCPWRSSPPEKPEITNANVYVKRPISNADDNESPEMHINEKILTDWEASNREMLSVLNFSDWFMGTVKGVVAKSMFMMENFEEIGFGERQVLWNDFLEGCNLLDSIAKCNQDCTKMTTKRIASQVINIRDSWLERVSSSVDENIKLEIRHADLNDHLLFNEELVEKARQAVK